MRFILLYCWLASWVLAQKEPPIDFDSPFVKTAILQNQLGQEETREILSAEKRDNLLELKKADGTLVVVPLDKVVAIVPKLPSPDMRYSQDQASQALLLLKKAQPMITKREEVSALALSNWERLARQKSNYESEAKKTRTAIIQNWFTKVSLEGDEKTSIALEEYLREGEQILSQAGAERPAMEARLEKVRQRMAIDFTKLDTVQLIPDWDAVSPLVPFGLLGILVVITVWGLLNVNNFITAIKMSLMAFLSRERSSKMILINSRSLVGIILGPLLLYIAYLSTRIDKHEPTEAKNQPLLSAYEKKAIYYSLNSHFIWSKQSAQRLEVSADPLIHYLHSKISKGGLGSGYCQFDLPVFDSKFEEVRLIQKFKVLWVPIQLTFKLLTGEGSFSLADPRTKGVSIGKIPLGSFIGNYLAEQFFVSFKDWDDQIGIGAKAEWKWLGKQRIVISTPEVSPKTEKKSEFGKNGSKTPEFKRVISAQELASVFQAGYEKVYINRYVDVSGCITNVSSSHHFGFGIANIPKGIGESPDVFWLRTGVGGPGVNEIRIKCVVKDSGAFFLDSRGDLYAEGQLPNENEPLVKKGMLANFTGGRIESFERNTIEIYGAHFSGTQVENVDQVKSAVGR